MQTPEESTTEAPSVVDVNAPANIFSPISLNRISGEIVDQVRQLIYSEQLAPGSRLPSERALCVSFGVSRVTVREALRVLEAAGLIEIKVGARGGAFVTAPTSERVGASITDLIALSGVSASEVTETRQIIDVGIVPLVCKRATEQDIADLYELCRQAEAARAIGEYSMDMSAEFHIRLARATHNEAITLLVQSFREPILMSLERAHRASPVMGIKGDEEHRQLVNAIRDRNVKRAVAIMTTHLERTLARVTED